MCVRLVLKPLSEKYDMKTIREIGNYLSSATSFQVKQHSCQIFVQEFVRGKRVPHHFTVDSMSWG